MHKCFPWPSQYARWMYGDGHHAWAAAELIALIRNMLMRSDGKTLVLASGVLPEWQYKSSTLSYGYAPTLFRWLRVQLSLANDDIDVWEVWWNANWQTGAPGITVCVSGFDIVEVESSSTTQSVLIHRVVV